LTDDLVYIGYINYYKGYNMQDKIETLIVALIIIAVVTAIVLSFSNLPNPEATNDVAKVILNGIY